MRFLNISQFRQLKFKKKGKSGWEDTIFLVIFFVLYFIYRFLKFFFLLVFLSFSKIQKINFLGRILFEFHNYYGVFFKNHKNPIFCIV